MKPPFRQSLRCGYTLIEVLATSAVVSVGMAAAVSLTSSMMVQEELAWRTAITRNYQENMARLWQLGLSYTGSRDVTNINAVMPSQSYSPRLNEAINGSPYLIETGTVQPEKLGKLQVASVIAAVNISADPRAESQGASFNLPVSRPFLVNSLRTEALNP